MDDARWNLLPPTAPGWESLRLQAHWLTQAAAAFARNVVTAQADDAHTRMEWDATGRRLLTQRSPAGQRTAIALDDASVVLEEGAHEVTRLQATGVDYEQLQRWLQSKLARDAWQLPEYAMPPQRPSFVASSYASLADLYGNAALAIGRFGELGVWPHHFDMATLVDHGGGRTVGIGLSPGDALDEDGYFYVSPYPYPKGGRPEALTYGRWYDGDWFGALLPVMTVRSAELPTTQRAIVDRFLDEAVPRATSLLHSG